MELKRKTVPRLSSQIRPSVEPVKPSSPMVKLPSDVITLATVVEDVVAMLIKLFKLLTENTFIPLPFWMLKAVVEEIFSNHPP